LLALFGAFAIGVVALRQWLRSQPGAARVIAHAGDLPVGGSLIFQFPTPTDPCILIRPAADTYLAFSRLCTHNACPIFYRFDLNEFICPCHNGAFSASDGSVLQGPPPKPLPRVSLELRGSEIVAKDLIRA